VVNFIKDSSSFSTAWQRSSRRIGYQCEGVGDSSTCFRRPGASKCGFPVLVPVAAATAASGWG